jgi:predicted CoA-binding protein
MQAPITLVLGASSFPGRYAFMAIRSLVKHGHQVLAVGARPGVVDGVEIVTDLPGGAQVHTVTLYLNAGNQEVWHDRILALGPKRIIFNPGAENAALSRAAGEQGIEVVEGCTLVMLAAGTY